MKANLPRITIVTPTLNQRRFIEATLASVWSQDYPDIEYLVVDGGSKDGTPELLQTLDGRLDWWVSEPDGGQSAAINKGMKRATGEVVAWLNSDDVLFPGAVRAAAVALADNPKVGLVYGNRIVLNEHGQAITRVSCPQYYQSQLRRNITIPQESAFFRRCLFEEAGGLDERLSFAMDFDLWCRLAKRAAFMHVPSIVGGFRVHGESKSVIFETSQDGASQAFRAEHEAVYRRHFGRNLPGPLRATIHRYIHRLRRAL